MRMSSGQSHRYHHAPCASRVKTCGGRWRGDGRELVLNMSPDSVVREDYRFGCDRPGDCPGPYAAGR
jgi:hypothetical protein